MLKIAIAQFNATLGDLAGNAARIVEYAERARAAGADLLLTPELSLCGYPPEDLLLRPDFYRACERELESLAARVTGIAVLVGHPEAASGRRYNAASVLENGRRVATYHKQLLPNYEVFDEERYFDPGSTSCVFTIKGVRCGINICADIWEAGAAEGAYAAGAELLLVLNASPYHLDKFEDRAAVLRRRIAATGIPAVYANLVGGQDELVFDGASFALDAAGREMVRLPQFEESLGFVDVVQGEPQPGALAVPQALEAQVYAALVLGVRDYIGKNDFPGVLIGLSGGIDSALVAAIACDAIGADNVYGVRMPSAYSSEHSLADAAASATLTGMNLRTVPINDMVDAYSRNLDLTGLAAENLQARVRGAILMGISNQEGHLVLATGNKSELAVGYSTIYGDAVGGFAPIKDAPKTLVWEMARWRNESAARDGKDGPIPVNSIEKPPSAELSPGQLDSDSLPDYPILDAVLDDYIASDLGHAELVAAGHDPELVARVIRMTDAAEWKRRQYPPGTKITFRAFGRDRRLPITNRWREPLD